MKVIVNKRYWHPIFGYGKFTNIKKNIPTGLFMYEGELLEIYVMGKGYVPHFNPVIIPLDEVFSEEVELNSEWALRLEMSKPRRKKR